MFTRILSATAVSILLGTAAFAQTAEPNQPADVNMPSSNWEDSVNETFFSDMEAGTLRSTEEINAGWAKMSAEQQASVRDECAKPAYTQNAQQKEMENSGSSSGGADSTTTSSTAGPEGNTTNDGASQVQASMASLCATINGLQ